jgi:hypothetical protein
MHSMQNAPECGAIEHRMLRVGYRPAPRRHEIMDPQRAFDVETFDARHVMSATRTSGSPKRRGSR